MDSRDVSELYDACYFATGCGRPYDRDEKWLRFFDAIAERIIRDIQPSTVLDAGCAMGFLVEALRQRGVEAFGLDVSKYAIQNVHPDIQSYCWTGSVTDPLPRTYDLIVCIEVLEHLPPREAEQAVENLCRHADDILFSSTPLDYKEPTHSNVQPPEYWAELFARHGFFRDVDFDASFITPWAVRFRKTHEPVARVIAAYERRFWRLLQENQARREFSIEQRNELAEKKREVQALKAQAEEKEREVEAVKAEMAEKVQSLRAQVREWEMRWARLESSIGWALLRRLQYLRLRVAPPGSRRERLLEAMFRLLQMRNREAFIGLMRLIMREIPWQAKVLLRKAQSFVNHWPQTQLVQIAPNESHQLWIAQNEPSKEELERQKRESLSFEYRPKISIITPVWNTDERWLKLAIESVLNQTYDNWELCIADGNSAKSHVKKVLQEYAEKDSRIKVKFLPENKGIAGNSNEALSLATGEFIGLLDHDDELAPFALYEVAKLLNEKPKADFIYSDEDKITPGGKRIDHFFKPDWSPDMFLSCMYTGHFGVYRKKIVDQIGGFRSGYEGSQDYDLVLRFIERTDEIYHVPKILYHWRVLPQSAAFGPGAKPEAYVAAKKAIGDYLVRNDIEGEVTDGAWTGSYRVKRRIIGNPLVSIIIPTRDKVAILKRCIEAILEKTDYVNYEILVVDNQSV
ncbi:MAG: glycosyltransferase, partial [Chloroflexota bacterium]|nr:glycosyltransferase [Chloroflexota bacterium]